MFRRCGVGVGLALLVSLFPLSTEAQSSPQILRVGQIVRLEIRGETDLLQGVLLTTQPPLWTLSVGGAGPVRSFNPDLVTSAEILLGHRRHFTQGAVAGLGVGLVIGLGTALTKNECFDDGQGELCDPAPNAKTVPTVLTDAGIGAGIGGLIGLFLRSERWVPAAVGGFATIGRGFALGWSLPTR